MSWTLHNSNTDIKPSHHHSRLISFTTHLTLVSSRQNDFICLRLGHAVLAWQWRQSQDPFRWVGNKHGEGYRKVKALHAQFRFIHLLIAHSYMENNLYADMTVVYGNKKHKFHKLVLCGQSAFFAKALQNFKVSVISHQRICSRMLTVN